MGTMRFPNVGRHRQQRRLPVRRRLFAAGLRELSLAGCALTFPLAVTAVWWTFFGYNFQRWMSRLEHR